MVIMGTLCTLSHFCALSFVYLFEKFWLKPKLLRFLFYFGTFKIDDEAAFEYSACFGETSLMNGSEFLKKLGRLTLRLAGEAEGCDS